MLPEDGIDKPEEPCYGHSFKWHDRLASTRVRGLSAVRCWRSLQCFGSRPGLDARLTLTSGFRKFIKSLVTEGRSEVYIFQSEFEDVLFPNCMDPESVAFKVKFV